MQRTLDAFSGFQIKKSGASVSGFFNPFGSETFEEHTPKPKKVIEVVNILDSPAPLPAQKAHLADADADADADAEAEESQTPILFSFTQSKEPVKELFPSPSSALQKNDELVFTEMIQPRGKDGQRLLYKYPNIPRVGPKGAFQLLVGNSDRSEAAWLIQFDGAANPNPGPASSGAVLWSPKDIEGKRNPVFESGKYLGKATNNIAEVQGLLLGLQIAAMRGAREILIEGDSELIIFQQTGKYKVSHKNLKVWWANIQAAMMDETSFDWIAIRQVPREQNERADSITKEVLSRKQSFQRA
jgi:ribonuclease HI